MLANLRVFLKTYPELQQMTGEVARFCVVLDANAAVSDLLHKHSKPHLPQTALEECIKSSVIEVYAPTWLDREMTESAIPQVAKQKNIPEAVLQRSWDDYKKGIVWDERFAAPEATSEGAVDPKDVPYVALAECISADGILTSDKDIDRLGGNTLTLRFVISARSYARASSYHVTIQVGGTVIGVLTLSAMYQLVTTIYSLASRLPGWARFALFVAAVVVAVHPTSREKVLSFLLSWGSALASMVPEIEKLIVLASEKQVEAQEAMCEIKQWAES